MPKPDKFSIMISRFPGGSIMPIDMPDTTDYFAKLCHDLKMDSRCSEVITARVSDTPITMSRNLVVEEAKRDKVTFLLMIDNDMSPDVDLGKDPYAEPFMPTALNFCLDRWDSGPHMVGAPYCGPPPIENVYIFRWATDETDDPSNVSPMLHQYSREEAATRIGFEAVGALPTGLILFDMRIFTEILKPPYFYYQWMDKTESQKASTEDVTMTRDAGLAGAKVWCFWSAWAGHWKMKLVGRPKIMSTDVIGDQMKQAVQRDWHLADRVLNMGKPGGNYVPPIMLKPEARDARQIQVNE